MESEKVRNGCQRPHVRSLSENNEVCSSSDNCIQIDVFLLNNHLGLNPFFSLLSLLQPVHLYSIQTCNSVVLGKKEMREKLDPRNRYTYCQRLHHMTVEPVDSEQELKRFWKQEDPKKWRTEEGCVGGRIVDLMVDLS